MVTQKLKSCPLCGSSAQLKFNSSSAWIECNACKTRTIKMETSLFYCAVDEVTKFWNKRFLDIA